MECRTLYYALGGGLGHVTRTIALARHWQRRRGGRHCVLTNTPFLTLAQQLAASVPHCELVVAPPDLTAATSGPFVARQHDRFQPTLWIVDTFPRGLGGELARLWADRPSIPRVLIGRCLPQNYLAAYSVREFVEAAYDMVFVPGEPSPWNELPRAVRLAPLVIRDAGELLSRAAAARRWGVDPETGCVVVVGTGTDAECRQWTALAHSLAQHWPDGWPPLRLAVSSKRPSASKWTVEVPRLGHAPLIELFGAVQLVLGSAGYHLVHESRVTGVAALLWPQSRRYDDQAARLTWFPPSGGRRWPLPMADGLARTGPAEIGPALWEAISDGLDAPWPVWPPSYENGAAQAAAYLEDLIEGGTPRR